MGCREAAAGATTTETPEISEVAVAVRTLTETGQQRVEDLEADVLIAASREVLKDRPSDMDRATGETTIEEIRIAKDAGPKKTASASQTSSMTWLNEKLVGKSHSAQAPCVISEFLAYF